MSLGRKGNEPWLQLPWRSSRGRGAGSSSSGGSGGRRGSDSKVFLSAEIHEIF
jgi:hypothetical protein